MTPFALIAVCDPSRRIGGLEMCKRVVKAMFPTFPPDRRLRDTNSLTGSERGTFPPDRRLREV